METEQITSELLNAVKEKIKLIKNTKGYNWEISINPVGDKLENSDLERLQGIDLMLKRDYGSSE